MVYAHSRNNQGQRHELVTHVREVARLAAGFADAFGAADLARWLGLWHDLGKFHPDFQAYLQRCEDDPRGQRRGPDHKAVGARQAARQGLGLAAMLIHGHHGGLATPTTCKQWLAERSGDPSLDQALALARAALPELDQREPIALPTSILRDPLAAETFLRLLFSALVDADFLDTERHFQPEQAAERGIEVPLAELWEKFERYYQQFPQYPTDPVGRVRRKVYEACVAAAEQPPGLYRLAVPTGGGKTLASMAFALRHALKHGQRRVIVAVPYISITEQTADIYQRVFDTGSEGPVVLEHHSAAWDTDDEADDFRAHRVRARLAAENWDASIVVTTTVQLFESLFANGTSRLRKVHRLARSVIILDEAQALPRQLLTPILDMLGQLCQHYGTTVVISTATQPAFDAIPSFASVRATDIVPNPSRHFAMLRRASYEWRVDPPLSWDEVAALMRSESQALAVVNTKKDAFALLDALNDPAALHLSTTLCGAHRRAVLSEVRRRLAAGEPCRLVSTQVVEAGVDLDFPLVLRAFGPLDAIIQAAGRCNREGRLERGRVIVFRPAVGGYPSKPYRTATTITGTLLGRGDLDPDDPRHAYQYFEQLFKTFETDEKQIQQLRTVLDYPEVARRFRMIEEETESVIVAYGSDDEQRFVRGLIEQVRTSRANTRHVRRKLQPYLVAVHVDQVRRFQREGLIVPVAPGVGEWCGDYDPVRGLTGAGPSADMFIV